MLVSVIFLEWQDFHGYANLCGACREHIAISDDNNVSLERFMRQHDAQVGPDAGWFAGSNGNTGKCAVQEIKYESIKYESTMMNRLEFVFQFHFNICTVTQFAYPVLISFIGFSGAYFLTCFQAGGFFAHVLFAPLQYLDDMPAKRTANRLTDLVIFKLIHGFFKLRHGVARVYPAQVAAI